MIDRIRRALLLPLLLIVSWSAWAAEAEEYTLGGGDIIRITVFQNPNMSVETRVSESGHVTVPLLGSVRVGGLTVPAAENAIAKALREGGFVLQPQVTILPTSIRSVQFSVLGQVNRPGRYPLDTGRMKLSEALAVAGGITPGGADSVILVGRRGGKPMRLEVDLPSIFLAGTVDQDTRVEAGDVLYVHRAPVFYVYGEVQRPGVYRIEREMTVMQALAQGGGLTPRGTERGLRLFRRSEDGSSRPLEPRMEERVRPDDVLYVRESIF